MSQQSAARNLRRTYRLHKADALELLSPPKKWAPRTYRRAAAMALGLPLSAARIHGGKPDPKGSRAIRRCTS